MANITFTEGSGLQASIFGKSQEDVYKRQREKRSVCAPIRLVSIPFPPVSYTHLDVYKRQVQASGAWCARSCCQTPWTAS